MRTILAMAISLIALTPIAWAGDAVQVDRIPALEELAKSLSSSQKELVSSSLQEHQVIDRLQSQKILTEEQTAQAHQAVSANLAAGVGQTLTRSESVWLETHLKASTLGGLFTFFNIVRVVAAILLVIAIGWLCALYLSHLPVEIWELGAWGTTILLLCGGKIWPSTDMWLVMPGALGVLASMMLTTATHGSDASKSGVSQIISLVCTIAWSIAAVTYASPVIGFMAVMALESFLGFSVLVTPLCYCIGFEKESTIPRAMMASLAILAFYVVTHVNGTPTGPLAVFSTGALFMGSFVYYIGCLIIGSKYYESSNHYMLRQLIVVISGVAALYFGATFGLSTLLGIGGTFFFLYLIEKYYELPWKDIGFAWSLLGLAGILYGGSIFAWSHPQYFLFVGR